MNPETLAKLRGFCRDEAAFAQLQQTLNQEFQPLQQEIEQTQFQVEQQQALSRVIARLRESIDLETIFQSTANEVRQLLGADRVGMFRFYPDSGWDDGEFVSEDVDPEFDSAIAQKSTTIALAISLPCIISRGGCRWLPIFTMRA